mmetsp:Transcript_168737/g.324465  ORF Transcript_168737/g.324465 Transcript_168737/m.324465 type:complete len:376 (+) Transcript_168737:96-1223(+)
MLRGSCAAPVSMALVACLATLQALNTEGVDSKYEPLQADCAVEDGSMSMLQKKASHSVPHSTQTHHKSQKATVQRASHSVLHSLQAHHHSQKAPASMLQQRASHSVPHSPQDHHHSQKAHHDSRHGKNSPKAHHKAGHGNSTHSHSAHHHHHHKKQQSWHKTAKEIADGLFSPAGVSVGSAAVLAGLAPGLSFIELSNQGAHGSPSLAELAVHEIEFEWKKGANATLLPRKSKVVLALLEGFFLPACLGVDRCYMGQPFLGTIKGLTLGGFFVWYLIDYIFVTINMFMRETYMNRLGFNACFGPENACFTDLNGPSEIQTAFWISAVFILIKCFFIVFGGRWGGKQVPGDRERRPFESAQSERLPYRDPPAIGMP